MINKKEIGDKIDELISEIRNARDCDTKKSNYNELLRVIEVLEHKFYNMED